MMGKIPCPNCEECNRVTNKKRQYLYPMNDMVSNTIHVSLPQNLFSIFYRVCKLKYNIIKIVQIK